MRTSLSVSCVGDSEYRQRLKLLSMKRGLPIGELVREALDARYGDLHERSDLFFAMGDKSVDQLSTQSINGEQSA